MCVETTLLLWQMRQSDNGIDAFALRKAIAADGMFPHGSNRDHKFTILIEVFETEKQVRRSYTQTRGFNRRSCWRENVTAAVYDVTFHRPHFEASRELKGCRVS